MIAIEFTVLQHSGLSGLSSYAGHVLCDPTLLPFTMDDIASGRVITISSAVVYIKRKMDTRRYKNRVVKILDADGTYQHASARKSKAHLGRRGVRDFSGE